MWPRLSHTHARLVDHPVGDEAGRHADAQPTGRRASADVGRHLERRDPAGGADHERGGRDGVDEEQQRKGVGLPPVGEPRPAPQFGRRPGRRGRGGERNGGRIEPLVEHVQDPDVDTGRDLRRQADAVVGIRRVEGRSAVVTDGGFVREVAQHQHRVHQVDPVLGEHGAHVGGRCARCAAASCARWPGRGRVAGGR